ncbi:MAG: Gfo/Idh/MocA family oxidoreductase [Desulfosarcinaceae bacterium]|jgi:predicted dehydrogenase
MPAQIGFAIVGSGHVSRYHHVAIEACARRGARLVAVASRDPSNDTAIRTRYGAPVLTFAEVCRHPAVDVVALCSPSGCHAEQAVAAARGEKHLIVEKPMAVSLDAADCMVAASADARRLLAVAFQRRTQPLFRRLKALVAEGQLGDLLMANLVLPYQRPRRYFDAAPWRGTWAQDGGGVLINQGIHLVDLLVWLWGEPVAVQAMAATRHHQIEAEDTAAAVLRFSNSVLATVTATTAVSPGFAHRLELYGTRGGVQIEGDRVVTCRLAGGDATARFSQPEEAGAPGREGGKAAGHIALYHNFLDALEKGTPLICDGREGRRSLNAILKLYEAIGLRPQPPPFAI